MFVHVATRRKPHLSWVTFALIAACVALYLWLAFAQDATRDEFIGRWGTVPARLFDADASSWQNWREFPWLRLFSALFIHAGWPHLLGNMLFLTVFGVPAERALGALRFLFLFLVGGALANLAAALTLATTHAPIVGSSGAVSAVIGAYVGLFPRARLGLVLPLGAFLEFVRVPASLLIGFWALLQAAFAFVGPAFGAIAWATHIAGFLIGIFFALLSRPAISRRLRS